MNNISQMKELVDKLNKWTRSYDEGHPEVSDAEWDEVYFNLAALEKTMKYALPNSPTQVIKYQVVNKLNKVTHNHEMLSLDKTKSLKDIEEFFEEHDVLEMCKMDGLTCSLTYKDGKLISAETRGDGLIGEDILHNALVIPSIPKKIPYKEKLIIDGEIISTYENFKSFESEYKNPRNFAAGSIRLLDSKECAKRGLTFIAWEVIEGYSDIKSLRQAILKLKDLGFTTVPQTLTNDYEEAVQYLQKKAIRRSYPIDGIVFKYDDRDFSKTLGKTEHHFKNALAYKFYDEVYKTRMEKIEWTMGRTGVLTPVAVFNPIDIDGTIVKRANLHNLSILNELGIKYQNQEIDVFKANQIIPQIAKAYPYNNPIASVKGMTVPEICPICGGATRIVHTDTSIVLKCSNPTCAGKLINHLDHFCGKKGLDIRGLSKSTLEKLIEWGWIGSIESIYNLKDYKEEWIEKPGFGEKSVNNILLAIEESKNVNLANFISAIGIPEIGVNTAKILANTFKTWESFREKVEDESYYFWELDNFGTEMNFALKNFNYNLADKVAKMLNIKEPIVNQGLNLLQGKNIVITGKLTLYKNRNALKEAIEKEGGKVTGSISSKTDILINNDIESTSAKNKSAKEKNIPILTESDFIKKFLTK